MYKSIDETQNIIDCLNLRVIKKLEKIVKEYSANIETNFPYMLYECLFKSIRAAVEGLDGVGKFEILQC